MAITGIKYTVDTCNCGDNSDADNERYAEAVKYALEDVYPGADVHVDIDAAVVYSADFISDSEDEYMLEYDDICDEINAIAQKVWDDAGY